MSKQVRWQIFFKECKPEYENPKHYRVDIYDEGYTGSPVQLIGGTSPFVTDEDDSDDYFAPIRVQTGTLTVCTHDDDGNVLITLDDILPANNIARPVRLVNVGTGAIEWQGFLSCEAYDQDYTDIPQHLQLPVISVLEAMASVEVQLDESKAFLRILGHICNAMKAIETESGMNLWGRMYLSQYCRSEMLAKYFYNNVYFSTEEQISGDNIVVEVHSISGKDILSQVAQFFGGCWREKGKDLYFEVIGKTNDFDYQTFANVYDESVNGNSKFWQSVSMTTGAQISQLSWAGTNHQRTVAQGAKRVRVTAGLDDFECKMTLQECPIGSLVENPEARQATWGEVHANTNETFYSLAEHKHAIMQVKAEQVSGQTRISLSKLYSTSSIGYNSTWFWAQNEYLRDYQNLKGQGATGQVNSTATSFMAWMRLKADAQADPELTSGLMICGLPNGYLLTISPSWIWTAWYTFTESDYLFKQKTPLVFAAMKGHFELDVEWGAFTSNGKTFNTYEKTRSGINAGGRGVEMAIKWGSKWLQYDSNNNSYSWESSFATFSARDGQNYEESGLDGKVHLEFPIDGFNAGFVSIYIFPKVYGNFESDGIQDVHNLFITKLDLNYVAPDEELLTDRSENVYAQNLSTAFRDEIETSVEIATDANNTKLATMLWLNDGTTPVNLLSLGDQTIRPEVDLLNRLAAYYGTARQRLSLIVAHPTAAPLPLLRLNGISPDNRTYAPLAESRDWQQDTSTLKCFETPNNE